MKPGSLVKRIHPRPQSVRHGIVTAIKGKMAMVKFTGSKLPVETPLARLEEKIWLQ